MINVSEAKKDAAFVYQGQKWIVLKQGFVKQARGAGIYILKCRNLLTNGISEFTIKSGENLEEVSIEKKKAQYLYNVCQNGINRASSPMEFFHEKKICF